MVHIIDGYFAYDNNYGYTVIQNTGRKNKSGEEICKTLGYCGTLEEVLKMVRNDVVHEKLAGADYELAQALQMIREETDRIMKALEGIRDI